MYIEMKIYEKWSESIETESWNLFWCKILMKTLERMSNTDDIDDG